MSKQLLTLAGVLACLGLGPLGARAQSVLSASGSYSQVFGSLATTGTTNAKATLPKGWDLTETGTSALADNAYGADNGASNGGNTYSYGATGSPDRALGSLLSSSLTPTIGASFVNKSGATLTALAVRYTGETWRVGGTNRADKLSFQYSTDATSLSTGTWTDVTALDYNGPSLAAVNTAGVSTPIQTATVSGSLANLNLPVGATIWIRWLDYNAAGSDDGLAIDDLSLTWSTPTPGTPDLTATPNTLAFGRQNTGTTSAAQTYSLSGTNLTGATTVTVTGPFSVSKDNTTFAASLNYSAAELATAQTVYVKFAPTALGAATGSIANASAGAPTRTVALTGTGGDPAQTVYDFNTCTGTTTLSDGWTQQSVVGAQTWACTTFGRDPNAPTGTTAYPAGVQINGYANGANVTNEDWLISPALGLSGSTYPLLSYWSRTAFNGPPLRLLVSTNYPGSGAPTASGVTWIDLNAAFPAEGSDTWTQTNNIDLSAYKQAGVYVAFVYTSTTDEGARWTIDDVTLANSATPAPPAVRLSAQSLTFGYQATGSSAQQTLNVTGTNLTGDLTVSVTSGAFQLSKDGSAFANSLTYSQAEASGKTVPVLVRFAPTAASTAYAGTITVASAGVTSQTVALGGNSYDVAGTLEVVNWNMEWFGSAVGSGLGPADKNLQATNASTVLKTLGADVYALLEVVDTVRLRNLVAAMPGYAYRVSGFGSLADDSLDTDYAGAQKLGFVYRTSVVSNPKFSAFFRSRQAQNAADYNYWSSGRFPFVMQANVTLGGVTKPVTFVAIHAKANTSPTATSYARRKSAADGLKAKLDADYAGKDFLVLGDFNDDLDQTITAGITPPTTSYSAFTNDAANYPSPTLQELSLTGKKSTVSYNDVIDHVITSKSFYSYFIKGTAAVQTGVANSIANYGTTTSDHYPVLTRYSFSTTLAARGAAAATPLALYPNPVGSAVRLDVPETSTTLRLQVLSVDGRLVLQGTGSVEQLNQQLAQRVSGLGSGLYLVRVTGTQQTYVARFQKL